jgi:hypothetical protein
MRLLPLAAVVAAMVGCKKESGFDGEGLPPAKDWNAEQAGAEVRPMPQPSSGFHGGGGGFHGTAPTDDQEGEAPSDDMQGAVPPNDSIHGGGGASQVPALPPPDPDRAIDPTHRIAGVIKLGPKAKGKAVAGTTVFVVAKHFDATGNPTGAPLAVARLIWKDDLPFELTEVNAMIAGTELTGEVIVTAHYDQDSEARSKQPGDILGQTRVKVPADHVTVQLDDVVP